MASDAPGPAQGQRGRDDDFDQLFAHANSNPHRIDCPSTKTLRALAYRRRLIDDPAYEHLSRCSPCYREFRRLQRAREHRFRLATYGFAAAAIVVVVASGVYRSSDRSTGELPPRLRVQTPPRPDPKLTLVDLRRFALARGMDPARATQPLKLKRENLSMRILLPVGFEPGLYDLRLLDPNQKAVVITAANAAILNYVTTLETRMDLSAAAPGQYELRVRLAGDEWSQFPVTIN